MTKPKYFMLWLLRLLIISGPSVHSFYVIHPSTTKGSQKRTATRWNSDVIRRHSTRNSKKSMDPEMDLGDILKPNTGLSSREKNDKFLDDQFSDLSTTPYLEEHDPDADILGDVPIPTTGISVADEMERAYANPQFYSEVVRITGLGDGVKAAQILSSSSGGGYEAVRYLVRLTRKEGEDINEENDDEEESTVDERSAIGTIDTEGAMDDFVMVDVPPFSDKLVQQMKRMMGRSGRLKAILVTCRDNIHYDDAPGVFTIRRADLVKWERAFPDAAIVAYRMDIPRDCRESITQRLDGYGPWAMQDASIEAAKNESFIETGVPLTYNEWDPDIAMDILEGKRKPPGEEKIIVEEKEEGFIDLDSNGQYALESIRSNEKGKRVLAVYTPGRTYGSMSYIFPELGLCASGYTLPLEDTRMESWGVDSTAGPALDCRGFVTTNKAGISRQMESARKLADEYSDRFQVVLTSRSDPFYLEEDPYKRRQTLLEIMDQYEKLGKIYEQLGITGSAEFD